MSTSSLCDEYTTALLKNNTAANQLTLITLLVNTVVIGNYTKPNLPGVTFPGVSVPGILSKGTVNGSPVDLLPYFDGGLASTNRGGQAVAVNFLDDGGATPLTQNKPASGTASNQYFLLTHLYEYFGSALGCSQQGSGSAFPAYSGVASQYDVHKFMALDNAQVTYFITQVGLAASSFGMAESDIKTIGGLLDATFNRRCASSVTLIPASAGPLLQSICITDDCQIAANANCGAYDAVVVPAVANASLADGLGNSSATAVPAAATFSGIFSTSGALVQSTSNTIPTSVSNASATPTPTPDSGLSNGAKIGIGVGVGLGGILVIAGVLAFLFGWRITKPTRQRSTLEKDLKSQREPGVGVDAAEPGVPVH